MGNSSVVGSRRYQDKKRTDGVNAEFRNEKSLVAMRKFFKLPKYEMKIRNCLRCGREFSSDSNANRLCHDCRR